MGTRISTTLHPSVEDNVTLRAWIQFVEDTFIATGGWVVTADTGQTLPSAFVTGMANGASGGYRVYRMNDALQATAPVFLKMEYGRATFGGQGPSMWMTIGKSTDGAGNVLDQIFTRTALVAVTNNYSNVAVCNSYGSAAPNRVHLGLFVGTASPTNVLGFSVERTKNALGADTGDGLLILWEGGRRPQCIDSSKYCSFLSALQPATELGIAFLLTGQNPTQTFGGDIGIGVITCFKGIAQQPGVGMIVVNSLDVATEGSFVTTIYGTAITYQQLGAYYPCRLYTTPSLSGSSPEDGNARMCMRFD